MTELTTSDHVTLRTGEGAAETPLLTLRVHGPGVFSGRISIADLMKICQEAQNAVNRQAEAIEGRKTIHPGPTAQSIRTECALELVGIGAGSTTLEFGLARPQLPLPMDTFGSFGREVVGELGLSIQSLSSNLPRDIDGGVLQSLHGLAALTEGRRISEIDWIVPGPGNRGSIVSKIDQRVQEQIAKRMSTATQETIVLDGVLDMADFRPRDRKCRIDPAMGAPIVCAFEVEQEGRVYELLRKPVRVSGEATVHPYTRRIEAFRISTLTELPSLELGMGNFFADVSVEDLAKAQKVGPLANLTKLSGGFPEDENIDEFLRDIYEARR